jgi:hypothetical protein
MQCKVCQQPARENSVYAISKGRTKYSQYCSSKCIKKFWVLNNVEKDRQSKQLWLEQNPEKRKAASEAYRKRNPDYYRQYASLRTRYVQQAKPKWVDEEKLLAFYTLAVELGLEVDHIIPIKHKNVCGLHVPANLQLLTRSENAKKGNKFPYYDEDVLVVLKKENE